VLIAATDEALEVARAQESLGLPVVVVEGDETMTHWTVGVDQVAGAELGTRHLVELGHTEIVHVAGPQSWTEARARLAGYQQAMYAAGLRPSPHVDGDWTARCGFEVGQELGRRGEVTAVFCANDHMALGVLRALSEAGIRVPDDISVVGFDDIPESEYLIPPLTTVRQDFAELGRRCVDLLLGPIDGSPPDPRHTIMPELVVRASVAAPSF
jgi:DNA-binding LacI/PurR family transcriptional regulator